MKFVLLLLATLCIIKPQGVEVTRTPATARRVMFDPQNPPVNVPKTNEGEHAIIESRFDARCTFAYDVTSNTSTDVTVRLRDLRITLSMETTIHLPRDVRLPLRTHEEGHRVISERIYDDEAEAIAREACDGVLAKSWTAETAELALARAQGDLRYECRSRIAKRIAEVNARYDQLTRHGKRLELKVIDAIDQAFQAPPSTRPTTTTTSENTQAARYRAYSTARTSRSTVTLISPG